MYHVKFEEIFSKTALLLPILKNIFSSDRASSVTFVKNSTRLAEQQRIVAKLDELMATCDALEASIGGSQRHNEQLLQQVLREALEPEA